MKKLKIALIAAAALMTASCVYDFEPKVNDGKQFVVVEGDIRIGDYSFFRVSESRGLGEMSVFYSHFTGYAYVECDDGTRVTANGSMGGYTIDTRFLDPSRKYRFVAHIPELGGKEYCCQWQEVHKAGVIDSLSYSVDPVTKELMWINVTAHNDNSQEMYYRWTCDEDWEYCADYYASLYYVPDQRSMRDYGPGEVKEFDRGENTNWCWDTGSVSEIMVGNVAGLSANKLINHKLYSIGSHDRRISYLYSPEVTQRAISEEAYRYWTTMEKNSDDVGGLFSPQPSEFRGNVMCLQDTAELVLGYVSASTVSKCRFFVSNNETRFYKKVKDSADPLPELLQKSDWRTYYLEGWLPYQPHYNDEGTNDPFAEEQFDWLPARCVDCTLQGGTKNKPSWWPSPHM